MKIAWCIYGQPRNYEEGYNNIKTFINNAKNKEDVFDFYIHCWFNEKQVNQYYDYSYRNVMKDEILVKSNTDKKILELYNPVDFLFEESRTFDTSFVMNSLADINTTNQNKRKNYSNMLSNFYSKLKVCELLNKNINDENTYDLIISTRFDYLNDFIIDLNTIDKSKFNIVNLGDTRLIIGDCYIITNLEIYNKYSQTINNLVNIINNEDIMSKCFKYAQEFELFVESMLLANLLYYYGDYTTEIITRRDDMLNFIK